MAKAYTRPGLEAGFIFKLLAVWICAAAWPSFMGAQNLEVSLPEYAVCEGGSITLLPEVSGGTPPYHYVWSPAANLSCTDCPEPVASPAQTTVYSLTVTDSADEEATATTTVTVELPIGPLTLITSDTAVCQGGRVMLTTLLSGDTTGYTYQWQYVHAYEIVPGTQWLTRTDYQTSTVTTSPFNSGMYYGQIFVPIYFRVIVLRPDGVCGADTSNFVKVSQYRDPIVQIFPKNNIVCVGSPLVLDARLITEWAGVCQWQWRSSTNYAGPYTDIPGATNQTYEPPTDAVGTMYYHVRFNSCSGPGCSESHMLDRPLLPVKVSVVEAAPSIQIAPIDSVLCAGVPVTLVAATTAGVDSCVIQWQSAPDPTGPWLDIVGARGAAFNPPVDTLTVNTYYRATYDCKGSFFNYDYEPYLHTIMKAQDVSDLNTGDKFCTNFVNLEQIQILKLRASLEFDTTKLRFLTAKNLALPGMIYDPTSNANNIWNNYDPTILCIYWPDFEIGVFPTPPIPVFPVGSTLMSFCFEVLQDDAPTAITYSDLCDEGNFFAGYAHGKRLIIVPGDITFESNCYSAVSNSIPVFAPPAIMLDSTDKILCLGQPLSLRATSANLTETCSLQWQRASTADGLWADIPDAQGPDYSPTTDTPDTSYYRVVLACQPLCGYDSLIVSDAVRGEIVSEMTLTLTEAPPLCPGNRSTLSVQAVPATGNFTFTWSNGAIRHSNNGQSSLNSLLPGAYCVTVTANNGCPEASACASATPAPPAISVVSNITSIPCNSSPQSGSISVSVSGSTPPYNYNWSNGATTDFITNLPQGAYQLTITDANGCIRQFNYPIIVLLTANAGPDKEIGCNSPQVQLQGSASTFGSHITYTWFAPDGSVIANQPWITVSEGGLYRFRVTNTDENDCYSEDVVLVSDFRNIIESDFQTAPEACNALRLSGIIPPVYSGQVDFEWTAPDGSISTGQHFIATQSGVYQLRTTLPALGCESVITRFVDVGNDECAMISGRIVYDTNEDCIADTDELGLGGWIVQATGSAGVFSAITNASGTYQFYLPLGEYSVAAVPFSMVWELCTPSHIIALTTAGQLSGLDIPAQFTVLCPEMEVTLSTPFLRRCFNSQYVIKVCNRGTETVDAPLVSIDLDEYIEYITAQIPPSSIDGQTISWTLAPLAPGQCRQFNVTGRISCNATLGQTHCSVVYAWPDTLCTPAITGWSGAHLEVLAECTEEEVIFRVRNTGAGDLTDPVSLIVIEDAVMLMQVPETIDSLASGEEEEFSFPANGSTYIFTVEQAPLHPFGNPVTVAIEGCGTNENGAVSMGFVNQLPLQTPTTASHILCLPNIGAYDPNDKQAIPEGYGPQHFIYAGDPMYYLIRFQNTGTDTAFTVIIRDTLSPWLDITTLRPGASSHGYSLEIAGERTLVFTFDNILLPDSTTNLDASQGFVDFFIHTADTIPLLTRIENSAAIYFDFNEPIITNTVFHTIGRDFFERTTATFYPPALRPQWRVFPNPTNDEAMLVLEEAAAGVKTAWLYDAFGRQVMRLPFEGDRCLLRLAGMAPGWYALRVTDAAGRSLGAGRVLLAP